MFKIIFAAECWSAQNVQSSGHFGLSVEVYSQIFEISQINSVSEVFGIDTEYLSKKASEYWSLPIGEGFNKWSVLDKAVRERVSYVTLSNWLRDGIPKHRLLGGMMQNTNPLSNTLVGNSALFSDLTASLMSDLDLTAIPANTHDIKEEYGGRAYKSFGKLGGQGINKTSVVCNRNAVELCNQTLNETVILPSEWAHVAGRSNNVFRNNSINLDMTTRVQLRHENGSYVMHEAISGFSPFTNNVRTRYMTERLHEFTVKSVALKDIYQPILGSDRAAMMKRLMMSFAQHRYITEVNFEASFINRYDETKGGASYLGMFFRLWLNWYIQATVEAAADDGLPTIIRAQHGNDMVFTLSNDIESERRINEYWRRITAGSAILLDVSDQLYDPVSISILAHIYGETPLREVAADGRSLWADKIRFEKKPVLLLFGHKPIHELYPANTEFAAVDFKSTIDRLLRHTGAINDCLQAWHQVSALVVGVLGETANAQKLTTTLFKSRDRMVPSSLKAMEPRKHYKITQPEEKRDKGSTGKMTVEEPFISKTTKNVTIYDDEYMATAHKRVIEDNLREFERRKQARWRMTQPNDAPLTDEWRSIMLTGEEALIEGLNENSWRNMDYESIKARNIYEGHHQKKLHNQERIERNMPAGQQIMDIPAFYIARDMLEGYHDLTGFEFFRPFANTIPTIDNKFTNDMLSCTRDSLLMATNYTGAMLMVSLYNVLYTLSLTDFDIVQIFSSSVMVQDPEARANYNRLITTSLVKSQQSNLCVFELMINRMMTLMMNTAICTHTYSIFNYNLMGSGLTHSPLAVWTGEDKIISIPYNPFFMNDLLKNVPETCMLQVNRTPLINVDQEGLIIDEREKHNVAIRLDTYYKNPITKPYYNDGLPRLNYNIILSHLCATADNVNAASSVKLVRHEKIKRHVVPDLTIVDVPTYHMDVDQEPVLYPGSIVHYDWYTNKEFVYWVKAVDNTIPECKAATNELRGLLSGQRSKSVGFYYDNITESHIIKHDRMSMPKNITIIPNSIYAENVRILNTMVTPVVNTIVAPTNNTQAVNVMVDQKKEEVISTTINGNTTKPVETTNLSPNNDLINEAARDQISTHVKSILDEFKAEISAMLRLPNQNKVIRDVSRLEQAGENKKTPANTFADTTADGSDQGFQNKKRAEKSSKFGYKKNSYKKNKPRVMGRDGWPPQEYWTRQEEPRFQQRPHVSWGKYTGYEPPNY